MLFRSALIAHICLIASALAQTGIRHLPAEPQLLLNVLPSPPKGWELTRSEAAHHYTGIIYSRAVREYTEIVNEVLRDTVEPMLVRVEIRDTCFDPTQVMLFEMEKEDLRAEEIRPGHWKTHPAILVDERDGVRETVRVLFEERFSVMVTYKGKDYRAAKIWLQGLNVDALKRYQPYVFRKTPAVFEMKKIDEIRRSRTRSYRMSIPGQRPPEVPSTAKGFAIPRRAE